jgi:phage tail sheath protein FI
MPINPTYPGVYIEEIPSSVRTIVGVSTSVTAFIGRALKGPDNKPTLIHNFGEFESKFGGLWKKSTMSYAVRQYFLNGGVDAIIVRVHSNAAAARFTTVGTTLKFMAATPGEWANNNFKVVIDHNVDEDQDDPPPDQHLFNLKFVETVAGVDLDRETFLNISRKEDHKRYVVKVLEEESDLVRVDKTGLPGALSARPPKADFTVGTIERGADGDDIALGDLKGKSNLKTGIYALENADIFNLLCIPPPAPDGNTTKEFYSEVYSEAVTFCKNERAMLIVDPPSNWHSKDDPIDASIGIEELGLSRSENAVIYFPRIRAPDALDENRLRTFPPCGVVAGIMAKTDAQRGVWKAPAGIDAIMTGVPDLSVRLTDEENGNLNPQGINCLRIMPPAGRIVWGARTMKGADRLANQWKYLPVRRTALYIEETLYRNTTWAVFEPNDEPLWAQLRLSIGAFMHDLFRKGAFQGATPKEAYLVKCDRETTTQYDIDRGIVNVIVGFAPLKPAEFVFIKIQQLAGQAEAQ